MSQSQMAGIDTPPFDRRDEGPTVLDGGQDVQRILGLLDDADCRAILETTGGEALSATEICDACDVPRSTAYRKLDRLRDAGLVEESLRVRFDGKHTREYTRRVDDVVVSVGDEGGVELELCH